MFQSSFSSAFSPKTTFNSLFGEKIVKIIFFLSVFLGPKTKGKLEIVFSFSLILSY